MDMRPVAAGRPLDGVRVLDLTRVWSGPLAGRILADLGAQVIHVTGRVTVPSQIPTADQARMVGIYADNDPGQRPWNRGSQTNDFHRNKLGLTLELNTETGASIFKKLAAISDVVLENYSPRVMPNFGLDYPALRAINPGIVFCSMPGFGDSGPYRDWVSFGTNLDPFSGLASLMGYSGGPAHISGNAYPDPVAALHAVAAILIALYHQRRTGQGQHIDLSQAESATALLGEAVLGYALSGNVPVRMGNRHLVHAPQGCYPCRGEDQWVTVAVSSEAEWQGLCTALGRPELAEDERFAGEAARWAHHDEIDGIIAAWTRDLSHFEAMARLQAAGVPAGAVVNAAELVGGEHLKARGFFLEIDHPETGPRLHCGLPFRLSDTPPPSLKPAPCLGQHNRLVLGEILGMNAGQIAALEEEGAIGVAPIG